MVGMHRLMSSVDASRAKSPGFYNQLPVYNTWSNTKSSEQADCSTGQWDEVPFVVALRSGLLCFRSR